MEERADRPKPDRRGRWKETAFFREGGDDCLAGRIGYTRLGPLLILALAGLYHPAAWPGLA